MTDTLVVLVTAPSPDEAARIARVLVEEKLCDEQEALLVLKAPRKQFPALRDRVVALHPYEVPEVIALAIEDGNEKYLDWIVQSMY